MRSTTRVHGRGLCPLQHLALLPVAHRVERVNDELGEIETSLFFVYFCGKYAEFKKLQFFRFNQKQCLFLTHSVLYFFEKFTLTNKKKSDFE